MSFPEILMSTIFVSNKTSPRIFLKIFLHIEFEESDNPVKNIVKTKTVNTTNVFITNRLFHLGVNINFL